MQWEDSVGGEGGGGEEGDAVSFITAVGAHRPCGSDGGRASSVGMLSQLQTVRSVVPIEYLNRGQLPETKPRLASNKSY